jgi:hypothetical protein
MRGSLLQSDHLVFRQIGYMHLSEKRQHVMLAEAEKFDVLHDHHLVVRNGVQRVVDDLMDVGLIAAGQKL